MPDHLTTPAVERAVCRLLGVDGVGPGDVPVPNLFVERLGAERLAAGAATWLGRLVLATGRGIDEAASAVAAGEIDLARLKPDVTNADARDALRTTIARVLNRLQSLRERRPASTPSAGSSAIRIGSGNAAHDRRLVISAIEHGARAVEIVCSPDQRRLDAIPYGLTMSGSGGTFVTQAHLALIREAIDAASSRAGVYVSLRLTASGPCLPEFVSIAAIEGVDTIVLEPGVRPATADGVFAREICRRSGMTYDIRREGTPEFSDEGPAVTLERSADAYWNPFV